MAVLAIVVAVVSDSEFDADGLSCSSQTLLGVEAVPSLEAPESKKWKVVLELLEAEWT